MKGKSIRSLSGLPFLLLVLALTAVAVWMFVVGVDKGNRNPALIIGSLLLATTALVSLVGLYTV
ncbi:hypothetical protein N4Q63_27050, partial [Leclercia adecarboxylata]|uniref:hypothetical protein n=1 Tax=Leclercia adecarboxylata TaxID=83655 RepID=UPI00234C08DB|nr:hypothetical protein [Leclercia adecarboxylata]